MRHQPAGIWTQRAELKFLRQLAGAGIWPRPITTLHTNEPHAVILTKLYAGQSVIRRQSSITYHTSIGLAPRRRPPN